MRALLPALLLATLLAACGDDTDNTNQPPTVTDTTAMLVPLRFNLKVDNNPFHLDSTLTTSQGVSFKVSNFRWYLSRLSLLDSTGTAVPVSLCDSAGSALPFNIHMLRADSAGTMTTYMRIYPGSYRGLTFGIGVPGTTVFDTLNHSDASMHSYPLNVDADMYWGWKAGYIFFKVEGTSFSDSARSFFYHIGDDKRYTSLQLDQAFSVVRSTPRPVEVEMNLARLFTAPDGSPSPRITSPNLSDRVAMSGPMLDTVARNLRLSNVFTLKP